jgi:hypothetical protein
MKKISISIAFALTLALGFAVGYVMGNHRAALQALTELQMISNSAYDATTNAVAKSVFASHYCGVLDRRVEALQNPLALFREHRGSYEPDMRSGAEIIRDLQRERIEWEARRLAAAAASLGDLQRVRMDSELKKGQPEPDATGNSRHASQ